MEVDLSDKPVVDDYVRCETPRIVTDSDLKETREEFQNLMFNKETEVCCTVFILILTRALRKIINLWSPPADII